MLVFKKVLFITIFTIITTPFITNAQSVPGVTNPINFIVIPESPQPESSVSVSVESYVTNLDKATFKWYVNGKLLKQGAGLKDLNVTIGKTGSVSTVSVTVVTSDIGTLTKSITLKPAEVSLVWESDTYTPPFYKGKALHSYNGWFRVTAITNFIGSNGKKIEQKNLIFTWKKNDVVDSANSGLGKDSYTTQQTSYLREGDDIEVTVTSPTSNISGTAFITVIPKIPELVFYENSPLYGIKYEKSLVGTFNLSNEEITVHAEPFNFSKPISGLMVFNWEMNGVSVPQFANKNSITLRRNGQSGQSEINLSAQHQKRLLQGAQNSMKLIFNAK